MVTVQLRESNKLRHRLANDVGAADHDRLQSGQAAQRILKQHQAAERRAGHQPAPPVASKPALTA